MSLHPHQYNNQKPPKNGGITKATQERWARFLSELPCFLCGIEGASQGAHINLKGQKSKGKKVPADQMIPLCHEGANGCHKKVDGYIIKIDREAIVPKAKMAFAFWEKKMFNDVRRILR